MRERAPGVWELIAEAGSDPVTGKRRQVSRVFRGKNRRARPVGLDEATLTALRQQVEFMEQRAAQAGLSLDEDAYLFSDAADGTVPWKPGAITRYFDRLRRRVGLEDVDFHHLRKFMETYGQNLGFSAVQVALRAGHDPSVAAKHYTGSVAKADRALASAVAALLLEPAPRAE